MKSNIKAIQILGELGSNIESKSKCGKTALMFACIEGNKECVSYLLSIGANVGAQTLLGDSALTYAQKCGWNDIALMLTQNGLPLKAPISLGMLGKKHQCSRQNVK